MGTETKIKPFEITAQSNKANHRALQNVRAHVIEVNVNKKTTTTEGEPGKSQRTPNDPFVDLAASGDVIEPPFDILTLAMLKENNTELGQCLDAMTTNIGGFGYRFVSRVKDTPQKKVPEALSTEVKNEKARLDNFFMYCTRESFIEFRAKQDEDLEATGNAYFEVIRDNAGKIQAFTHLPSYQIRIGRIEDEHQHVDRPILEIQPDGSVKIVKVKEYRRFRKYVQSHAMWRRNLTILGGRNMRWFKEFGDERVYDVKTGEIKDENWPVEKRANEVIHRAIYSTRSSYGLPRFIGNLLSIFGDRASEEINFVTFSNNNIPSMVIMVSNGQLTEGTIGRLESFVESQIQGSDNYSKFLLMEAEGTLEGEEGNQVKMEIKPLVAEQHKDALFQAYSKNNQEKIRRAFRLPPIFVGKSDDYTRSTAETSRRLADEQIFAPEREKFDALFNRILFPEMGILYHRYRSNSPNVTDDDKLVKILAGAEKTGGITPAIARNILEDILGTELPDFPPEFASDVPFSLTMAAAVKNQADPAEPAQQVTALKQLYDNVFDDEPEETEVECEKCGHEQMVPVEASADPMVDHLVTLNRRMEKKWQEAVIKTDEDEE